MSNLNQFFGPPAVTSIVNGEGARTSSGVVVFNDTLANVAKLSQCVGALSGATTANTLKTALDITGTGGYLDIAGILTIDATSRNVRVVITLDGIVVFDQTTTGITSAFVGFVPVGGVVTESSAATARKIFAMPNRFNSSCKIEFSSSLSETDKLGLLYAYRLAP